MALPANVNYGTVVGQFLLAYADGVDVDVYPDGVPAKGNIYFKPSPIKLQDASASPNPVTILPATVDCVLDAQGYLLGSDGTRGVRLVATDDADLNPTNWTWTVEFRLSDQNDVPVSVPSFSIALPSDTEVDLTVVAPVAAANGTYYIVGPTGPANVLTVGTTTTLTPEASATVEITGSAPAQTINFGIPQGVAATLDAGTTTTTAPGTSAAVTNSGTTADAVFDFSIPQGAAATLDVGTTTTVVNGTPAAVSNSGTTADAVFDFTIPAGPTGPTGPTGTAATIDVGTVATVTSADDATVTNSGTTAAAIFDFEIPQGRASTLAVGAVTTAVNGTPAAVSNSGTTEDAVFDFTIPAGPTGPQGPIGATGATGITWQGQWVNSTDYVNNDAVFHNGASWFASGDPALAEEPTELSTHWYPLALQGIQGIQGDAATIAVGTVTTGAPADPVVVTNVGTSGAAIFDFTIPKGDQGDLGDLSATSPVTYSSNTIGLDYDALVIDGGSA